MVRTRFAPSPTGYLHIGGVRTALFNWLFARRGGGRFILRIDDTDAQRNVAEALRPILDGFRWLGLDWDEGAEVGGDHGPYHQSLRQDRYREVVTALVERGAAYHDYATAGELQSEREAAQARGERFVYSRRFLAVTGAERRSFEAQGRQGVVRLMMPREDACRFSDLVRGGIEVEWAGEQDHVVQRADGTCLYHLASVVDDHDMEISHVIRAEEHLSNTPRQIFIFEAMGWDLPEFAHLPYVAEPGSRNKLSKRKLDKYLLHPDFAKLAEHGRAIAAASGLEITDETFNPVLVDFYEKVGYLPDAILNYLLLLGWSLDDKTEIFSRDEMIARFSLERVNRAPASFDSRKLAAFQERYMQALPHERKVALVTPFLERAGLVPSPPAETAGAVSAIVEAAGDRIKVGGDILEYAAFFLPDDGFAYDDKAVAKWLRKPPDAPRLLAAARDRLRSAPSFEAGSLESLLQAFFEEHGARPGQVVQAIRVAVTGKAIGFGLFETLAILGRDRCLARIERALSLL